MSDSDFDMEDGDDAFARAAEHVQRLHTTLDPGTLLELYGFYKQATVGRCNIAKPNIFQMQARAKWSAWNEMGEMTSSEAQKLYVAKVRELDSNWKPENNEKAPHNWVVHSIEAQPSNMDVNKPESEKTAVDYVKEMNLLRLQEILAPGDLQRVDENGMGLIHWAADRNALDILEFLLTAGADINQRDGEQQTPLHYAASCGYLDAVHLLLSFDADLTIADSDNQTCYDVADSEEVRKLIKSKAAN